MCELLVRVVDKTNIDSPYLDAKCLKRGDVVVVAENGWAWSVEELRNPDWRIVKIPNFSVLAAAAFLGLELDLDPEQPSLVLRRRAFALNLAGLPANWAAWVADSTRVAPTRTLNVTEAQALALKLAKVRLVDPNVIG